jgi:drug/metabolite transporter (DMT)-like permease
MGPGLSAFSGFDLSHCGWLALSIFASYGLGDSIFLWATLSLGVPAALAISSSYPIWTALIGLIFRHEALTPLQTVGLLVTVGGVIVVILSEPREGKRAQATKRGLVLAFISSLFWAINGCSVSQGGEGINPAAANAFRMATGMAMVFVVSRISGARGRVLLPMRELRRNWWLFLVEAFLGSLVFVYGLSHSRLAVGATLASLAPVLSVPVAWAAGIERFSFKRTAGICLVVSGLCLLLGFGIS